MGTIVERRRRDGTVGYLAQIVVQREGETIRENKTFERKPAANNWIKRREGELRKPGAVAATAEQDPTLRKVIDRYVKESVRKLGRTKAQALEKIKTFEIADKKCSAIGSDDIVTFVSDLVAGGREPSTAGNYLSHLSTIFTIARPAWKYPLSRQAMDDAIVACRRLGLIGKSNQRARRPTLDELDGLMAYFAERERRDGTVPMTKLIAFGIFSTRRESEITRLKWKFYEPEVPRVMVEDMKDPGQKVGNNVWTELDAIAKAVIESMPKKDGEERIFPFHPDVVSRLFTDACKFLEINDLVFHDLRHDGVSRLFELGKTIPQVASFSGHKSWSSLQRYTHLRHTGDKYAGWKWLTTLGLIEPPPADPQ